MKIQQGDYVNTTGFSEEKRREVVKAFLDAGCPLGEEDGHDYCNVPWELIGWNRNGVYYHSNAEKAGFTRELTLDQLLGAGNECDGLPPVGTHCEVTWGARRSWHEAVIIPSGFCYLDESRKSWVSYENPDNVAHRPLRTDQQRFTEQFKSDTGLGNKAARKVYEAGYRKGGV